jgi:hypothetical protein
MQMTLDAWLARIPFRYELLLLLALLIWLLWSVAAGMTGVACGMALVLLTLIARSVSQLKRGNVHTVDDL